MGVGVMVGRLARDNPCDLWDVDRYIFNEQTNPGGDSVSRHTILDAYCRYLATQYTQYPFRGSKFGPSIGTALKPVCSLFANVTGDTLFRETLQRLQSDADLCTKGPAAVLRRVVDFMEENAAYCPAMYDPLAPTGATPDVANVSGALSVDSM